MGRHELDPAVSERPATYALWRRQCFRSEIGDGGGLRWRGGRSGPGSDVGVDGNRLESAFSREVPGGPRVDGNGVRHSQWTTLGFRGSGRQHALSGYLEVDRALALNHGSAR